MRRCLWSDSISGLSGYGLHGPTIVRLQPHSIEQIMLFWVRKDHGAAMLGNKTSGQNVACRSSVDERR